MTARTVVRDHLRADLEGWDIRGYPFTPSNVRRNHPAVAVWRTDLLTAARLQLTHPVTVNLYGSRTSGEEVEEELDGHLDQLLLSLQRLDSFAWTTAVRSTWGQLHGWSISGTMTSPDIYANTIRGEHNGT